MQSVRSRRAVVTARMPRAEGRWAPFGLHARMGRASGAPGDVASGLCDLNFYLLHMDWYAFFDPV